jgi:hypothetical protein
MGHVAATAPAARTKPGLMSDPAPGDANAGALVNGVKALAEIAVLPGSSLLMTGETANGLLHTVGAVAAAALFGPIGWGLVVADSLSKSIAGRHLWQSASPTPPKALGPRFAATNAAYASRMQTSLRGTSSDGAKDSANTEERPV